MNQETLVGISEACQILKVSETALRQWTDEGKIKAFVTPGGHRRYLVADLKKFMSPHQKAVGIRDLVVELEDAVHPLREIARTSLSAKSWYNKLDIDSQQSLASLGRNMLQTIINYFLLTSVVFIFFGLFSISWLVIHIEHGRHFSKLKVAFAIIIGSIFLGFGIHFILLSMGI